MSTVGRNCPPPPPRNCESREPSFSLKSPARYRTGTLLLFAALLPACIDAPVSPPDATPEAAPAEARLATIARSLASAMNSAGVRLDVLADMRASPRVDHSLILGDYLLEPRAGELLDRSADALGVSGTEFTALVRGLGELELLAPITKHRLTWTGSAGVAVAAQWNSDVLDIDVYEPSGEWLEVLDEGDWRSLHGYGALFMVRPRETDGTRIGRQPDVPGPVIQDPGDGQRASILKWRVAAGEVVSFDVGQYELAAEFRAAVAEVMETRGVWGLGTGALADGAGDSDDCEFDDDDCDGGPPGGGGGGLDLPWEDPATFIERIKLTKQLDEGGGDMELRLQMFFLADDMERPFTGPEWTHMDVALNDPIGPTPGASVDEMLSWLIHYVSVKVRGAKAWVEAVEMDPFPNPDDQLGTQRVRIEDNGEVIDFLHEKKRALELTLQWEVEDPDGGDPRDRGPSG